MTDYKPANIDAFARAIYQKQCDYTGPDHEAYCVEELKTALGSMEAKIAELEGQLKRAKAIISIQIVKGALLVSDKEIDVHLERYEPKAQEQINDS